MRRLLIAAAVAGTSLTAIGPASAKSFWIECGFLTINLDSSKERFLITRRDKTYQGNAVFSADLINFETVDVSGDDVIRMSSKDTYEINRKTLEYNYKGFNKTVISVGPRYPSTDSGWREYIAKSGRCSIMKTPPTAGNQI